MKTSYEFRVCVRTMVHGQGKYFLVVLPKSLSEQIRTSYGKSPCGFGAVPVLATMGSTSWQTSLFLDRRSRTYFLLSNQKVRRQEGVVEGDEVAVTVSLR